MPSAAAGAVGDIGLRRWRELLDYAALLLRLASPSLSLIDERLASYLRASRRLGAITPHLTPPQLTISPTPTPTTAPRHAAGDAPGDTAGNASRDTPGMAEESERVARGRGGGGGEDGRRCGERRLWK